MGDQDRARIMVAIVDWNARREVGSGTEASHRHLGPGRSESR